MRRAARDRWLTAPGILIALLGSVGSGRAAEGRLAGRVADASGAGVAGVTLLVTAVSRPAVPYSPSAGTPPHAIEAVRSSGDGSFVVAVPPGLYRLAALKSGYEVAMAEASTLVRGL